MRKLIIFSLLLCFFLNGKVHSQITRLSIDGQLRIRAEHFSNRDFLSAANDKERPVYQRTRFQVVIKHNKYLQALVQFQDSRNWGEEKHTKSNMQNLDLHQGFIEYKPEGKNTYIFRIGRQEMVYGDGRLIGNNDWNNIGRAFDALRLIMRSVGFRLDFFLSKLAHGYGITDNYLYGTYYTKYFGESSTDFYFIGAREYNKTFDPNDDRNIYNIGGRINLKSNKIQFKAEAVYQMGRLGLDDNANKISISAYGLASELKVNLGDKLSLGGELTLGSGDDNPASGDVKTLQTMYPNQHKFLGIMDFQTWPNAKSIGLNLGYKSSENSNFKVSIYQLGLNKKNDYWYGKDGIPYSNTLPVFSSVIGREIDCTLNRKIGEYMDVQAGAGIMLPGDAVKEVIGSKDMPYFLYISSKLDF